MKQLSVSLLLWLSVTVCGYAQSSLRGTIRDDAGQPLPGATIIVRGTTQGTTTDDKGTFTVRTTPTDVLEISSIGYQGTTVTVGNRTTVEIALKKADTMLDEVVVMGYTTTNQRNLTGSAQVVTAKELKDVTANSVGQMLQGKAAGVFVGNSSGDPRAGTTAARREKMIARISSALRSMSPSHR